jgi:hypothetical protein
MLPTNEQIEVAAYHIWERRGRRHGRDREDWEAAAKQLTYSLNYEPVQEYGLFEPTPRVLGKQATRHCRFCERNSKRARFGPPSPVIPIVPNSSLLTAEICEECQAECRDPLVDDLARFWESLGSDEATRENHADRRASGGFSLGAYKSLVASALLILPDREMPYFLDAIEWVGNPDRGADERLFAGTTCRAYRAPDPYDGSWVSLDRRIDDSAPLPYMIALVSCNGVIVQFHLPLCSRDEDLDGRWAHLPERLFVWGHGWSFRQASSPLLPLLLPGDRGRSPGRRRFVEC